MRCGLLLLVCIAGCTGEPDVTSGPARLSETGLYADFGHRVLAERMLHPSPQYPLWSDGADKSRFLLIPEGERIDTSDMDAWRFPVGTRVWKTFSFGGKPVETRYLEKRKAIDDGGWLQLSYAWADDGSDAYPVPDGVKGASGLPYDIPSQRECGGCHYKGEKPVIGVSALQLSRSDGAPSPLDELVAAGVLSDAPTHSYSAPGSGEVRAALGYLHGNCAQCHDRRSAARDEVKVFMDLRVDDTTPETTAAYTSLVAIPPHHFPDVGVTALVEPGAPDKSLVYYRINRRDDAKMPPLGTRVVDAVGVATIAAWIDGLAK